MEGRERERINWSCSRLLLCQHAYHPRANQLLTEVYLPPNIILADVENKHNIMRWPFFRWIIYYVKHDRRT